MLPYLPLPALLFMTGRAFGLQTLWPPDVPLVVRSPYFNAYMPTSNLWPDKAPGAWPQLPTINRDLGWGGFVRVDGVTYQWLGNGGPGNATSLISTLVTPTRTIFSTQAGPLQMNLTFFSPIEVADISRQSFPFAYLYIDIKSIDGQNHDIQIFSDICGQWVTGNDAAVVQWDTTQTANSLYHRMSLTTAQPLTELNEQTQDGTLYFASSLRTGLSWQTGADRDMRGAFNSSGGLQDTQDTNFRNVGDHFPVLSFALDLGNISSSEDPVVWAVGMVRNPSVQYVDARLQTQNRTSYFWTRFSTIGDAIDDFLQDFPRALQRADAIDQRIRSASSSISDNYSDLVSLVTSRVLGATELTVPVMADGSLDSSDIKIFMKDIGFSQRMNPVESLYAALPAFLFLNASLVGFVLEPLLDYQNHQDLPYALSDLGQSFPIAAPTPQSGARGVEDTASMLIMTLAHAMYSGDGSLISRYYSLLRKWADYLVGHTFGDPQQVTSDIPTPSGRNSTNLAVKGIIGIQSMSLMSQALSEVQDAAKYSASAVEVFREWRTRSFVNGRVLQTFSDPSSGGLIYNLYAHRLLNMSLIDAAVFSSQDSFYQNQLATLGGRVGLPLSTSSSEAIARLDWSFFTAGSTNNPTIRNAIIDLAHKQANNNETRFNFITVFDSNSGANITGIPPGKSSPSQGALFSLLALTLPKQTLSIPPQHHSPSHRPSKGAIAGIIVACLAVLAIVTLGGIIWLRKHRERARTNSLLHAPTPFETIEQPHQDRLVSGVSMVKRSLPSGDNEQEYPSSSNVHIPAAPASTASGSLSTRTWSTAQELLDTRSEGRGRRQTELLRSDLEALRMEMERMRMAVERPPSYGHPD
ncbi:hypothetical protein HGRIS_006656 [Hohenbuehelia grisea]|uniref:DUF1793-domain-containing protein n=1 Tax=Hohenbuehelia grisea TaxID=104357 RepID=A0ABR3J9N8_9AGAR